MHKKLILLNQTNGAKSKIAPNVGRVVSLIQFEYMSDSIDAKNLPIIYRDRVVGIGEINKGKIDLKIWRDRYDVPENNIKISIEYKYDYRMDGIIDQYEPITLYIMDLK